MQPVPPAALRGRVGRSDDVERFDRIGRACREGILEELPGDFSFDGRSVLDFGCGAGRMLRHFAGEAARCEFHACDIDAASVAWLEGALSPPFHVFRNDPLPPLPLASGSLDAIIAVSVFTHLADDWSAWLVELHRLLAPGGLLAASYLGPGVWPTGAPARFGFPYDERVGMHVEQSWRTFDDDFGPAVWHSEWWLRERWGRLFEFVAHRPQGFAPWPGAHDGQGLLVLRRREAELSAEDLERPGEDPREAVAAAHSARLTRLELGEEVRRARDERDALARELEAVRSSRLMRRTEPLRRAWYRLRGG